MMMTKIKEDLQEAFNKGRSHDFRPTLFMCFNRWFNEKFVDAEKCKSCKYSNPRSKTNYKTCEICEDCKLFEVLPPPHIEKLNK